MKLQVVGKLLPSLKKLWDLSSENFGAATLEVLRAAFVADWLVIGAFWVLIAPAMKMVRVLLEMESK